MPIENEKSLYLQDIEKQLAEKEIFLDINTDIPFFANVILGSFNHTRYSQSQITLILAAMRASDEKFAKEKAENDKPVLTFPIFLERVFSIMKSPTLSEGNEDFEFNIYTSNQHKLKKVNQNFLDILLPDQFHGSIYNQADFMSAALHFTHQYDQDLFYQILDQEKGLIQSLYPQMTNSAYPEAQDFTIKKAIFDYYYTVPLLQLPNLTKETLTANHIFEWLSFLNESNADFMQQDKAKQAIDIIEKSDVFDPFFFYECLFLTESDRRSFAKDLNLSEENTEKFAQMNWQTVNMQTVTRRIMHMDYHQFYDLATRPSIAPYLIQLSLEEKVDIVPGNELSSQLEEFKELLNNENISTATLKERTTYINNLILMTNLLSLKDDSALLDSSILHINAILKPYGFFLFSLNQHAAVEQKALHVVEELKNLYHLDSNHYRLTPFLYDQTLEHNRYVSSQVKDDQLHMQKTMANLQKYVKTHPHITIPKLCESFSGALVLGKIYQDIKTSHSGLTHNIINTTVSENNLRSLYQDFFTWMDEIDGSRLEKYKGSHEVMRDIVHFIGFNSLFSETKIDRANSQVLKDRITHYYNDLTSGQKIAFYSLLEARGFTYDIALPGHQLALEKELVEKFKTLFISESQFLNKHGDSPQSLIHFQRMVKNAESRMKDYALYLTIFPHLNEQQKEYMAELSLRDMSTLLHFYSLQMTKDANRDNNYFSNRAIHHSDQYLDYSQFSKAMSDRTLNYDLNALALILRHAEFYHDNTPEIKKSVYDKKGDHAIKTFLFHLTRELIHNPLANRETKEIFYNQFGLIDHEAVYDYQASKRQEKIIDSDFLNRIKGKIEKLKEAAQKITEMSRRTKVIEAQMLKDQTRSNQLQAASPLKGEAYRENKSELDSLTRNITQNQTLRNRLIGHTELAQKDYQKILQQIIELKIEHGQWIINQERLGFINSQRYNSKLLSQTERYIELTLYDYHNHARSLEEYLNQLLATPYIVYNGNSISMSYVNRTAPSFINKETFYQFVDIDSPHGKYQMKLFNDLFKQMNFHAHFLEKNKEKLRGLSYAEEKIRALNAYNPLTYYINGDYAKYKSLLEAKPRMPASIDLNILKAEHAKNICKLFFSIYYDEKINQFGHHPEKGNEMNSFLKANNDHQKIRSIIKGAESLNFKGMPYEAMKEIFNSSAPNHIHALHNSFAVSDIAVKDILKTFKEVNWKNFIADLNPIDQNKVTGLDDIYGNFGDKFSYQNDDFSPYQPSSWTKFWTPPYFSHTDFKDMVDQSEIKARQALEKLAETQLNMDSQTAESWWEQKQAESFLRSLPANITQRNIYQQGKRFQSYSRLQISGSSQRAAFHQQRIGSKHNMYQATGTNGKTGMSSQNSNQSMMRDFQRVTKARPLATFANQQYRPLVHGELTNAASILTTFSAVYGVDYFDIIDPEDSKAMNNFTTGTYLTTLPAYSGFAHYQALRQSTLLPHIPLLSFQGKSLNKHYQHFLRQSWQKTKKWWKPAAALGAGYALWHNLQK